MIGEEQNNYHLNTFSKNLISWHKIHGRHNLPWQKKINPYRVWISEVMLQQTQVKTVLPYYKNFMKKYPDIKSLSHSELDEILESWTGLGYYRRARNLYQTSQILRNRYEYKFPELYEEILELPGIGKSTAGAILSLAYNKKYPILDGNVKRVIRRYFAIQGEEDVEKNLWDISQSLLPNEDNNIYTQSIMDLGAMVCVKNSPICKVCPINKNCKSYKLNLTEVIPNKKIKSKKKKNIKLFLVLIQGYKNQNLVLMQKNKDKGIWANLWGLPTFEKKDDYEKFLKKYNLSNKTTKYKNIKHSLTHLNIDMNILKVDLERAVNFDNYYWKNIYDSIGLSKPVVMIFNKLKKEINQCVK